MFLAPQLSGCGRAQLLLCPAPPTLSTVKVIPNDGEGPEWLVEVTVSPVTTALRVPAFPIVCRTVIAALQGSWHPSCFVECGPRFMGLAAITIELT